MAGYVYQGILLAQLSIESHFYSAILRTITN